MLTKTEGVILKSIKYNDNSNIVTIFTKDFGRLTFFVRFSNSKKSNQTKQIIQPCYIVSINFDYNQSKDIQNIKEIELKNIYFDIPFNFAKTSIVMMISEILFQSIKHQNNDLELYNFLTESLTFLDIEKIEYLNFHLIFLINLSSYLGFSPENNFSKTNCFFDLKNGIFIDYKAGDNVINEKDSYFFYLILVNESFFNKHLILNNSERRILLQKIIDFYSYHVEDLSKLKSLNILQQVFSN